MSPPLTRGAVADTALAVAPPPAGKRRSGSGGGAKGEVRKRELSSTGAHDAGREPAPRARPASLRPSFPSPTLLMTRLTHSLNP